MNHNCSKPLINLLRGWPNPKLLPAPFIKAAANTCLSDSEIYTPGLLYGPDAGYEPLREEVARWLTNFYRPSSPISLNRICITGGASQNLACVLQVFTDPIYTNVWMIAPTYFLACRIFEDNGFSGRLRAVPEDEEGLNIEFLERELRKSDQEAKAHGTTHPTIKKARPWSKIYRHLIYAVPTFANPSSKTMSLLRRQQLVRIAREHDALIVSDDVYDQLQWDTNASKTSSMGQTILPRLVDVDRELDGGSEMASSDQFGNTLSNGSFSKILGPGCRTGWAEGTEKLAYGISQTGSSRSGGAPSHLTATFVSEVLKSGDLENHILHTLQPAYASRYHSMMKAIEKELLPLGVTLTQPERDVAGGYFIWLSLPEPLQADELAEVAKRKENLIVAPGSIFAVVGDEQGINLDRDIRLCFSWEEEEKLSEGIRRLGSVMRHMKEGKWQGPSDDGKDRDVGQYQ
ncbi:MAG: hypothetical protein M1834_007493 [Cirrosporium novae-zelandiae]|nr:MAG: hypothetical protein M1834_007493 [Cirrosporium novae-zelandiae]